MSDDPLDAPLSRVVPVSEELSKIPAVFPSSDEDFEPENIDDLLSGPLSVKRGVSMKRGVNTKGDPDELL